MSSKLYILSSVESKGPTYSFNLRRAVTLLEWLVVAGLSFYLGVSTLSRAWNTLNTDFPNYYLSARLLYEKFDTSRIYEWLWIQRQKDHRAIGQGVVGMISLTPFSTLVIRPLASLPP